MVRARVAPMVLFLVIGYVVLFVIALRVIDRA